MATKKKSEEHIIEINNLKKTYYTGDVETPVLRGLDLKVKDGEFIAIMGPSGSGKSTLMHIMGFLDKPTGGSYHFEGVDVSELSDDDLALVRRERIGFVFQAFFLLPRATVIENVMLPLLYQKHSHGHDMAKKALDSVGLSHRLDYLPTSLSGGEKQRTAIARALINAPSVIFADEPTGNLDSKSGKQVMNIFQKLNEKGHTIILVTHEKTTAQHAERIIHIRDGLIESEEKVKGRINYSDGDELLK
ncbi:ATP-binding cassette domain-containing protein [Candidatus Peregrinibacteria bacterium]|nr:ATP-binding cassette domain-containing protein [Candidatus Peregrinibacteria bacterium]